MIDIITPIYKGDTIFIEECLISLRGQAFLDFRWIIVTAIEESEIKKYLDDDIGFEIQIINIGENTSVGKGRNIALEACRSEYVYFLDIDDYLQEHTLFCLMENIKETPRNIVIGYIMNIHTKPGFSSAYSKLLRRVIQNRNTRIIDAKQNKLRFECQGILFNREFLENHHIRFDEEQELYSDMVFVFKAYDNSNRIIYEQDAVYMKKSRSDTIRYPSLKNRYEEEDIILLPNAVYKTLSIIRKNLDLKEILEKHIIKDYYTTFNERIFEQKDNSEFIKETWSKTISSINSKYKSPFQKIEVSLFKNKFYTIAGLLSKIRRGIKLIRSNRKQLKQNIYKKCQHLFKVNENWIIYESFLGKNISDSPKYIYQYLYNEYPGKYKHIWVLNESRADLPKDIIQVKRFSAQHIYYVSKAKFWVSNMRQPVWFIKKNEQVFLQTWHGTPLKKLVFDMEDVHSANKNYKRDFYSQSRAWDYLVSANSYSTKIFRSAFLFDKEILQLGYPRNDLLYNKDIDAMSKKLKKKLGLPIDKKIVLYAPTWRDDDYYKPGQYKFKLPLDLEKLKDKLGDEYHFLLRTHYFIADHLDTEGHEDFVYNASKYDDISELYLISDILITDYSSVYFDYANLKRPIIFFTYDLDKYRDTLRGFYLDMEKDSPGPLVKTNDELIEQLSDYEQLESKYKEKLEHFYDEFCTWDDGKAAKRVAEEVIVK